MSIEEYRRFCKYRGDHILMWLRDGPYECDIMMDMAGVDERVFMDILAVLKEDKRVELYDNDTKIRLADPGRLYLLNKATDIVHAGDGLIYKRAYPGGVSPDIPKSPANTKFKLNLRSAQKKSLETELREQHISSTPKQLLAFLAGEEKEDFKIEKLQHFAYLISRLAEEQFLKPSNGYFKYIDAALYHRGVTIPKGGIKTLKRSVIDKRYAKNTVQQDIDKIIDKLKRS